MLHATAPALPFEPEAAAVVVESAPERLTSMVARGLALSAFAPVSLEEMDGVALLDRHDTKYVLSPGALAEVINTLGDGYRVLEIGGVRLHPYHTIYFDTPAFDLYHDHHRGRPRRYKVRSREYACSGASYFEVKAKDKRERTSKVRVSTPALVDRISESESVFLDQHAPAHARNLSPQLRNDFHRVTLVSTRRPERLTLDLGLRFSANGRVTVLNGVAIAEVKQSSGVHDSEFVQAMRARHQHPAPFSKYCIGAALHYDHLKHNRFGSGLRLVDRLMRGTADVC